MERGVRQGCVMGPCLFNLVFDEVIKTAILKGFGGGITLIDEHGDEFQVNRLAYADDLCIIDSDIDRACKNLDILRSTFSEFGLTISASKTKVMCLTDDSGTGISQVMCGDKVIEWVSEFCYLGSILTTCGSCSRDIGQRLRCGMSKLRELQPAIQSNRVPIALKRRLIESSIFPAVYYGSECWATPEKEVARLQAFHNTCTRTALGKTKLDRIRNTDMSIGLPEARVVLVKRRIVFFEYNRRKGVREVKRVLNSEMASGNRKVSGRKKQLMKERIARDMLWLFGGQEDLVEYQECLNERGILDTDEKFKHLIKGTVSEKLIEVIEQRKEYPKMLQPRIKRVQCTYPSCFKAFAEQKELRRHIKNVHTVTTPQRQIGDKPFRCPMENCHKTYKTDGWLKRHLLIDHRTQGSTSGTSASQNNADEGCTKSSNPIAMHDVSVPLDGTAETDSGVIPRVVLDFRLSNTNDVGIFRCPFTHCTKRVYTAKALQNHGTRDHDWSFLTGKPKRARALKARILASKAVRESQ